MQNFPVVKPSSVVMPRVPGRTPVGFPQPKAPSVSAGVPVSLPVMVGELQVKDIRTGSVLTITTEAHIYTFNIQVAGRAMMMTNNELVKNGLVVLHGSWDYAVGGPIWGSLSRGKGLLFAHLPDVKDGTKTSPVVKITLTRKGL
jgi:hypothetical protein